MINKHVTVGVMEDPELTVMGAIMFFRLTMGNARKKLAALLVASVEVDARFQTRQVKKLKKRVG